MQKRLTLDEKVKIWSLAKTGTKVSELAKDFCVSRQTISAIIHDEKYADVAEGYVGKVVERRKRDIVERLDDIKERLVSKFEGLLETEDDIRKLTDLYKNISHDIQILKGNPTEIKETRTLHVDARVIANLSPEEKIRFLNNQIPVEELQNE